MKINYVPNFTQDPDCEEGDLRITRIRANRKELAQLFGRRRSHIRARVALKQELINSGALQPLGCDCSHCRNDWDCCGNMTVSFTRFRRVRRGFLIIQHRSPNL